MNQEIPRFYVEELRRRHPLWLLGRPSAIALFGAYILDSGDELGYEPCWTTTVAEDFMPQQSTLIERAFGVAPIQRYGLVERVANISETPKASCGM